MRHGAVEMMRCAGIEPDPWQADLLRSQAKRVLLNCCRQSGKSTTAAGLAVYTALYEPESPVLLLSPSLRQSSELFRKCADIYRAIDKPVEAEAESALRVELENGSRIISLPGKEGTVRGISAVKLLIIDEASRVPDELYRAVRPMLAVSGGRLVLMSTPWGKRGFYWDAYQHRDVWQYFEVPATECPRISHAFLAEEEETMGRFFFEQEYLCVFSDTVGAAFREEDIARIVGQQEVETWSL